MNKNLKIAHIDATITSILSQGQIPEIIVNLDDPDVISNSEPNATGMITFNVSPSAIKNYQCTPEGLSFNYWSSGMDCYFYTPIRAIRIVRSRQSPDMCIMFPMELSREDVDDPGIVNNDSKREWPRAVDEDDVQGDAPRGDPKHVLKSVA